MQLKYNIIKLMNKEQNYLLRRLFEYDISKRQKSYRICQKKSQFIYF